MNELPDSLLAADEPAPVTVHLPETECEHHISLG